MTMPAVVFTVNGRIALEDRPTPTLRPDQVLVEVDLRRICGSDLHASQLPQVYRGDCILGHESTGRVAAVGDDVAEWAIGQRVAVNPNGSVDGTCAYCRSGRPNFCRQASLETALGLQADGALAPLMAAFPGHLRRIPDELGSLRPPVRRRCLRPRPARSAQHANSPRTGPAPWPAPSGGSERTSCSSARAAPPPPLPCRNCLPPEASWWWSGRGPTPALIRQRSCSSRSPCGGPTSTPTNWTARSTCLPPTESRSQTSPRSSVHCLRRWLRSTAARRRNREGPHCAGRFRYRLSTTSLNRHNKTTKENLNDRARHMALNCSVARAGIEPATFRFSGGRSYRLSYLAGKAPCASPWWRP
ncbi:MAG: hypothetical protein QOD02_3491 [Mycobacterium sp.]|nr:hypothetical protein [Mycobacterium sp.]